MKLLSSLFKYLGIIFIIYILYLVYAWDSSANEIKQICSTIKIDSQRSDVETLVLKSKYARMTPLNIKDKKPVSIIHSTASFGRHTCFVEFKNKKVVHTEYSR